MPDEKNTKILELDVEGFRSLRNISWRPGDLNVIIGRNGSGKSNLLRFIEVIAACAQGNLNDLIGNFGGMNSVVWDGKTNKISFRLKTSALADYSYPEPRKDYCLTYEATLAQIGKTSSYRIEKEELANYELMNQGQYPTPFWIINRPNPTFGRIFDDDERSFQPPDEAIQENEALLALASNPLIEERYRQAKLYSKYIRDWTVYQDFRTDKDSKIRQPVDVKNLSRLDPDGQNLVNVLHTLYESPNDPEFKELIDEGMLAAFGSEYKELKFSPDASGKIQLGIRWNNLKRVTPAPDLSDGTLRYLLLLTVLTNPNPPSLIAIDEPEIGLHPRMLPIVTDYAASAAQRTQVIFTTHSAQFLNAFKKEVVPTTTVALWFKGKTYLKNPDQQRLNYWLERYNLGELLDSNELENMALDELEKVG